MHFIDLFYGLIYLKSYILTGFVEFDPSLDHSARTYAAFTYFSHRLNCS